MAERLRLTCGIDRTPSKASPGVTNFNAESQGGTVPVNGTYNGENFVSPEAKKLSGESLLERINGNRLSDPEYLKRITKAVTGKETWEPLKTE